MTDAANAETERGIAANFAYYLAFAEAIRASQYADPTGDISALVAEYQAFMRDNPPDPSL